MTSQPPNVILVVSTAIPSILGAALAPNILVVTAETVIGTSTTTTNRENRECYT